MCIRFKNGRLVYNGVRQMVKQHIDNMVAKQLENMANSQEGDNQVMLQIDQLWSNFAHKKQMILIRDCCYYLEHNLQHYVEGGELALDYAWRLFRTELLENQQIKSALLASCFVLNSGNGIGIQANPPANDDVGDYDESSLFNVDTIIEIMTFLTTFKLGLQVSTAARQMAKLSDYVLTKRKPILRPIAIWNGDNNSAEPFATKLKKEFAPLGDLDVIDNWYTSKAPEFRICLPDTEPPEWLAVVEQIYVMGDDIHDKTFRFFNALRNQLQNCHLSLNISGFFAKLQETGQASQFFQFFNERCFSLNQLQGVPFTWQDRTPDLFTAKWPLWAIFNNIFFPNCRKLALSHEVEPRDSAKWLMHPSTECGPRLLELRSASANWIRLEFVTMLQQIREDFFNPTGKRMFFVEFSDSAAIPDGQQGEWQNGIGEQLRISSTGITRLPKDQCQMDFKNLYDFPAVQPKLVFK